MRYENTFFGYDKSDCNFLCLSLLLLLAKNHSFRHFSVQSNGLIEPITTAWVVWCYVQCIVSRKWSISATEFTLCRHWRFNTRTAPSANFKPRFHPRCFKPWSSNCRYYRLCLMMQHLKVTKLANNASDVILNVASRFFSAIGWCFPLSKVWRAHCSPIFHPRPQMR